MARSVTVFLCDFPDHAHIIGDIVLAYSEIEAFMIGPVADAMGTDVNASARILYRLRGAQDRLQVIDAIVRPHATKLKLIGPYTQWFGAMRRCKQIRNQYAHCGWAAYQGRLHFADLTEAAQSSDGDAVLSFKPIELSLLEEQHEFFSYTMDVTRYLMRELQFRRDRRRRHKVPLPKSRAVPSLYSRPKGQTLLERLIENGTLRGEIPH